MENYLHVEGGKIWYQVIGSHKKGVPLVIIHGGPGYPSYYLENLKKLATDRPVIFYDQLGCGRSGNPQKESLWTVNRYIKELHQLVAHLHFQKLNILGHSWGGYLAAAYVLKYPSKVNALILASPFLSTRQWMRTMNRYLKQLPHSWGKVIRESEQLGHTNTTLYKTAKNYFSTHHEYRAKINPVFKRLADKNFNPKLYRYMWGNNEYTITGTLKNADLTSKLQCIKVPTLITCGRHEAADPVSMKNSSKKITRCKVTEFINSAHMSHIEEEKKYIKIVKEFFKEHEA